MVSSPDSMDRAFARLRSARPVAVAPDAGEPCIRAAVIALISDEPDPSLVFIERADRGDPWSGQIAFPGGRLDPADGSPEEAALRELHEELGIPASDVLDVCGLGAFRTLTHAVEVTAFVGRWAMNAAMAPDEREVADVLALPLRALRATAPVTESLVVSGQGRVSFPVYTLDGVRIWGLTARILQHLLGRLGPDVD